MGDICQCCDVGDSLNKARSHKALIISGENVRGPLLQGLCTTSGEGMKVTIEGLERRGINTTGLDFDSEAGGFTIVVILKSYGLLGTGSSGPVRESSRGHDICVVLAVYDGVV